MTIKLEKDMNDMCNLSRALREENFRKGFHKSIRKGNIETIRSLMSEYHFSFEEAIELLDLDESKIPKHLALMQTN